MQGDNETINTKVGLDLPMSEQVRQRQVTLDEGKTLVNTKGVYGSKFGNKTHFLSFAAIVATAEMGQRARIFMSEVPIFMSE